MIRPDARLSLRKIPIECIQVKEYQPRYPGRLLHYIGLLTDNPGMYAGVLYVTPSDTHQGMFVLLDGHHKFCAAIIAGRADVWCVVEEPPEEEYSSFTDLAYQKMRELELPPWSPPQTGPLIQGQD